MSFSVALLRHVPNVSRKNFQVKSALISGFSALAAVQLAHKSTFTLQAPTLSAFSSIPDTISPNSEKFVHLTSVDQILNKDSVNWDRVSTAFQTYYQRKDEKSSFRLLNRIYEMGLIPPANILGLILRLLSQQDVRLSTSSILTVFENVVEKKALLSDIAVNSLIWSMRKCNDPFARAAFYNLFQVYFAYSPTKGPVFHEVYASFLHSLVESGELEEAKRVFEQSLHVIFKADVTEQTMMLEGFPWNNIFEIFVSKWNEVQFGITVIESMERLNLIIPHHFWHILLESSISTRHVEGSEFVWKKAVQTSKIFPSDSALSSMLQLYVEPAGNSIPYEALQKLSLQDPYGAVSISETPHFTEIMLTSPTFLHNSSITLQSLLNSICTLNQYMSGVDVRDLDLVCELFWNLVLEHHITPEQITTTLMEVVKTQNSTSNKDIQTTSSALMNFVLRACNQNQAASTCLHFYRSLVQQGAIPDSTTFESISFAALCLGNSKKLGYLIYQECQAYNVKPTGRMIELLLRGSLKGTDYSSTLYYISRMNNPRDELPQHLIQHLTRSFNNTKDNRLHELLSNALAVKGKYLDFPSDRLLEKSASPGVRDVLRYSFFYDKGNCYRFVHGWPIEQLPVSTKSSTSIAK